MVHHLRQSLLITMMMVLCIVTATATADSERLAIAADSGLKPVLADISAVFTRQTGIPIDITTDASGLLEKAIENGKTYDLLLAADEETASNLLAMGLLDGEVAVFAYGRLAVVTAANLPVDEWQQWIRSSRIAHIALPDPEISPYGRETMLALQALGLSERVRERLMPMSDVSEVLTQAKDDRTTIAFLPTALLRDPGGDVQVMELPPTSYHLLAHTVSITAVGAGRAADVSRRFADFLAAPDARDILLRHGYRLP